MEPIARTNNTPATRLATLVGLVGKARDLILSLRIVGAESTGSPVKNLYLSKNHKRRKVHRRIRIKMTATKGPRLGQANK